MDAGQRKNNGFSTQINSALSMLTSKFGGEINEAFQTAPATQKRGKETEQEKREQMREIEENQKAIKVDMGILQESKSQGLRGVRGLAFHDQFVGFEMLGKEDYLDDSDEDSESDSESDSDYTSEDSDCYSSDEEEDSDDDDLFAMIDDSMLEDKAEKANDDELFAMIDDSMRGDKAEKANDDLDDDYSEDDDSDDDDSDDDDSDDDDSDDDDSDFDDLGYSSDESSIGSYGDLLADMEGTMGIVVPDDYKNDIVKRAPVIMSSQFLIMPKQTRHSYIGRH